MESEKTEDDVSSEIEEDKRKIKVLEILYLLRDLELSEREADLIKRNLKVFRA